MYEPQCYIEFLRERITELRLQKKVSEHHMSLDLGKSDSYIRSITNGITLPSVKELFNIMIYLDVSPTEFFDGVDDPNSIRTMLRKKMLCLSDEDVEKVSLFVKWIDGPPDSVSDIGK